MSDTIIMPAAGTPISGAGATRGKHDISTADGTSGIGFLGTLASTLQTRETKQSVKDGNIAHKGQENVTDTSLQDKNSQSKTSPSVGTTHTGSGDSTAPVVTKGGNDARGDAIREAENTITAGDSNSPKEQAQSVNALWKKVSHQATKKYADKAGNAGNSLVKKFAGVRSAGIHSLKGISEKGEKAPVADVLSSDKKEPGEINAKNLSRTVTGDKPGRIENGTNIRVSGKGNTSGKSAGTTGLNAAKMAETVQKDIAGQSMESKVLHNVSTVKGWGDIASDTGISPKGAPDDTQHTAVKGTLLSTKEFSITQKGTDNTQATSGVDRATPRGQAHVVPPESDRTTSSVSQGVDRNTLNARVIEVVSQRGTEKSNFVEEVKARFQVLEGNGEKNRGISAGNSTSSGQHGNARGTGGKGNAHQSMTSVAGESCQGDGDRVDMLNVGLRGDDTGSKDTREFAFPRETRLSSEKTRALHVPDDTSASHTEKTTGIVTARNDHAGTAVKESSVVRHVVDHTVLLVNRNGGRVQLNLQPSHLGSLNLAVQVKGDKLRITITADKADVQHILEANVDKLRESLTVSGIDKNDIDVNVEHRKSNDQPNDGSAGGRFADLQGRGNRQGQEAGSRYDVSSMDPVAAENLMTAEHGSGRGGDGSISVFA